MGTKAKVATKAKVRKAPIKPQGGDGGLLTEKVIATLKKK